MPKTKKKQSLLKVVNKPGRYISDISELKREVENNTANLKTRKNNELKIDQQKKQSHTTQQEEREEEEKQEETPMTQKPIYQEMVGIHVSIPKDLRNKLKLKAVSEGQKIKDILLNLIERYVASK